MKEKGITYSQISGRKKVLPEQIKMIVALSLSGLILTALETTVLARIPLPSPALGRSAPALSLLFCMAVGFVFGEHEGGLAGLFVGWIADAGDAEIMLLPLFYLLCGYVSGLAGKRRLAHNLPSFTVFAIVAGGIRMTCAVLMAAIRCGGLPPGRWILSALLPAWLLTVLFSPLVYGLIYGEQKILVRN